MKLWNSFEPLLFALSWAYYRRDLADITEQCSLERRRVAKQSLDRIRQLCDSNLYGKYSPWPTSALKLSSILTKRWPRAALDLLQQIDFSRISDQPSGGFPADRDRWFMQKTKALEALEDWHELMIVCTEARTQTCIETKNQKWIRLRLAEAWRHTERSAEAEPLIASELKKSGEWWLYARYARVLLDLGRDQEALDAAYRALVAGGASSKGWETIALAGGILERKNPRLACDHVQLARLLRAQEGWPTKPDLESMAERLGATDANRDISVIFRKLQPIWQNLEDARREVGTVKKHLNEGAGFIDLDSGGSLFFSLPRNSKLQLPVVGSRVSFVRQKSFDAKKNQESERAAKWRVES